ncbi:FAD-dependent oxidoreductase [Nocardia huaxiensis]|uniref:FAD-dependent oxidoreductase n=1 Tax=Nocardia huaxiensis TaxID=2755382 RepID=A0A7D6ZFF8_9NOCA|nr:FAD-dependent oxidoreductase [Nocardia huaxiensis]QLY29067.1 FAD-dependent oxidoreductase [Nocardia huaxiensis]
MDCTTCVIVGGGPAGMFLGLLLARAGVEVTVLEKHADFLRDFRGDTVHPTTMDLLDELGLGEEFAKLPQRHVSEVQVPIDGRMRTFATMRRLPLRHRYIAMVPQWDLLDLLARAADTEPAFHLRMKTEVTGLIREGGRVTGVRYRDRHGRCAELRADLTVACDGRTSAVRAAAGLRTRAWPVPFDVWWFRLPRTDRTDPSGDVQVTAGQMVVLADRGDYWQCAVIIPEGRDAELRRAPVTDITRRMAEAAPWLADRTHVLRHWDEVKLLTVQLDRLHRWYTEGLLCLGDAAHAMSPLGGVGINLAVQDAVAAARILAPKLLSHTVEVSDLARVQRRRGFPTRVSQRMQRTMHAAVVKRALRDAELRPESADAPPLLRVLRHIPIVRSIPLFLMTRGVLPEHAPDFARRPPPGAACARSYQTPRGRN